MNVIGLGHASDDNAGSSTSGLEPVNDSIAASFMNAWKSVGQRILEVSDHETIKIFVKQADVSNIVHTQIEANGFEDTEDKSFLAVEVYFDLESGREPDYLSEDASVEVDESD